MKSEQKTILLVEDEVLIAMVEKTDLEEFGYNVITAHSGKDAIEIFRRHDAVDLVLMDINLGNGIDGTEAATSILNERESPVVFLSSHTEPEIVEKTEKITSYGYVVKNSGKTVLDASIKMAFKLFEANRKIVNELKERERVESALRESEKIQSELLKDLDRKLRESEYSQLWNVYAQSRVPTLTLCKSGKIVDFNKAMADLTGYTHKEVPDFDTLISRIYPDENIRREILENHRNSREKRINDTQEVYPLTTKDGESRYVIISVYDIMHEDQYTDMRVVQCEDITEQKKIEQALRENEIKYRTLFKSMGQGFYLSDIICDNDGIPCDYRYIDVNSAFEQIIGLNREQIVGRTYNDLVPPDPKSGWIDCFKRVAVTGIPENYTFSSQVYHVYFETYAFRPDKGKFAALVKDVTDRMLAEKKINELLKEKELILKEAHHRIKNNMNVVYGLLTLQSSRSSDPVSGKLLREAASRIQSMTVLYDKLYRSDNISSLSIKEYFPPLIDEIVRIFPNRELVKIETRIDDVVFNSQLLSALGLILNECITNAMKFAFKDRDDGLITISVEMKDNHVTITFADNGVGLPESVTIDHTTGFGMQLIGMIVKQINGSITIDRQSGTKFIIEFDK
jgi:PAS domain S-box-containing protein